MRQRSPEWFEARRHKITASKFGVVMNGGVDGWNTYIEEVRFGWRNEFTADSTDWGIQHEDEAILNYEIISANDVVRVGFIVHPEIENVGGSPDGFVGDDGLIEVKCPFTIEAHERTLNLGVPLEHIPQIQGNLWITGRKWCDFVSYDPRQSGLARRCFVQRVERCERFIGRLAKRVAKFREILASGRYAEARDFQINPFEDDVPQLF